MKNKKQNKKRIGADVRTLKRQQDIRNEVYGILHQEAHKWFETIRNIEDNSNKRLNAMEQSAMPHSALQELKEELRKQQYTINKNTKALESLLNFFNVSKDFLNQQQ